MLLANSSIAINKFSCFCMYLRETLAVCLVQKITKGWMAFAPAASFRPFYKTISSYFMFNCTRDVSPLLSTRRDGFGPRLQAYARTEASVIINEKELGAVNVLERSATVDKTLRFVTYLPVDT